MGSFHPSLSRQLVYSNRPIVPVAVLVQVLQRGVDLLGPFRGEGLVALVQQQGRLGVLNGVVNLVL